MRLWHCINARSMRVLWTLEELRRWGELVDEKAVLAAGGGEVAPLTEVVATRAARAPPSPI